MQIPNTDYEQFKAELITLYFEARKRGDIYVMEETDYLLQKLQTIEAKNLKKKNALKS